ncbi:hypothetical protein CMI37_27715 [Candidatus Pacearchaeota archaeon]|nr:hypothetical protein [Candidatus Pacearchaeota archaeon]
MGRSDPRGPSSTLHVGGGQKASMNFILSEMTFLRYYIPLVIEGNRRGVVSNIFVGRSDKYNCPCKNLQTLHSLSNQYGFDMFDLRSIDLSPVSNRDGPIFLSEGVGIDLVQHMRNKKISTTYMDDFNGKNYARYINKVDHIIFPSEYVANHYEKISEKNLYLGSPKYDYGEWDKEKLLEKYELPHEKFFLVVFPRTRDLHKIDMGRIYDFVRSAGYKIIVKTRGKDPISNRTHMGDYFYMDYSWYPHDTMELIHISDFVINFDSTAIKECAMLNTPVINFDVKPRVRYGIDMGKHRLGYSFLYEQEFCQNLRPDVSREEFANAVEALVSRDLTSSFSEARKKYLFEGNSSKRILDYLEIE